MSRIWKTIIILAIMIAIIIGGAFLIHVNSIPSGSKQNEGKTHTSQETELMPEIETKKNYTGYCAIYGRYRNRYVECTGDYDPDAKARAEAKAKECNESDKAVHGCTDRYQ